MRRREFIAGLGVAAWPLAARAQNPAGPTIGLLHDGAWTPRVRAAWIRGLEETGYIEGRNLKIEYRRTLDPSQFPELAADLVRHRVAVIATPGSGAAALAAKAATARIPIVFGLGTDPVQLGLVASLNRPGANVTGYQEMQTDVVSKRLSLLRTLAPAARRYGILISTQTRGNQITASEARAAAEAMGLSMEVISIDDDAALDVFFSKDRVDALLVAPGTFFFVRRQQVIRLAASHDVAVAFWLREFPEDGGLMSYGSSLAEMHRAVGNYVGRILNGANPADLPVMRTTKFELVINAKAAKGLGLSLPATLLAIADEIIE